MEKYRSHPQFIGVSVTDPNQQGALGDTMLHLAAEAGAADIEVLVAAGANVNAIGDNGNTPLHSAAMFGEFASAKRLLELGADPKLKNEFDETAENVAKTVGHDKLTELLKR